MSFGITPEDKVTKTRFWLDTELGLNHAFTLNGSLNIINVPKQGSTSYQRTTNRITLLKGELTFMLYPALLGGTNYYPAKLLKVALVYDRNFNSNATPIFYGNVFQDINDVGVASSSALSGPNLKEETRYLILREWIIPAPGFQLTSGQVTNVEPYDQRDFRSLIHETIDLRYLETAIIGPGNSDSDVALGRIFIATAQLDYTGIEDTNPAWAWMAKFRLFYES